MIELVAMVKEMEKPDSGIKIIPVYYDGSWNKLFSEEKQLKIQWQKWASVDERISLEEWMKALNTLKQINGIHNQEIEEASLRHEIVNATLNLVSPESWQWGELNVQGKSHLYEV